MSNNISTMYTKSQNLKAGRMEKLLRVDRRASVF